jgi:hypothetical protein
MSSSSRALASAQQRRTNPSQPQPQSTRPNTSINSGAAFAQQQQSRIRNSMSQPQPKMMPPSQQQPPIMNQQNNNGLPFTKLSISDAIGLITLRLGRVEQHLMNSQDDEHSFSVPENMKMIDHSVLNSIVNRLDSLEKSEISGTNSSSNNSTINNNSETISKLERELRETKDLLMSLMYKFETFVTNTNSELERLNMSLELQNNQSSENDADIESDETIPMGANLKELIQQELNAPM